MRNRKLIQSGIFAAVIAIACLAAGAGAARADMITLDISGTLHPFTNYPGYNASCAASGCTLAGTLVINNTTGTFISANITMSGSTPHVATFTQSLGISAEGDLTRLPINNNSEGGLVLYFITPIPGSLVGYNGGPLIENGTMVAQLSSPGFYQWNLTSGSLTPAITAAMPTPEPASWLLLATGLLGLSVIFLLGKRSGLRRVQR